jgi:hypothetical protein
MKKFAGRLFVFGLFFVLFFILINFFYLVIIAFTDWDFIKRLEFLKFDNPDFELLVFGNSFSEYGIDTELLNSQGIKSYNMALVGSSHQTSYIQLNEYLAKCSKRPQYVLLCINSFEYTFNNAGIQPIVEFTMKDHVYGVNDIPVSKFRWLGLEFLKKIVNSKYRKVKINYGQIKYPFVTSDNSDFKELYLNTQKIESSHWIGEIAKFCNQNGLELIIAEMPGMKETQNLSEIGPYILHFNNGFSAVLYNFGSRDFCKFIDARKDWGGMSHFNQFGAAKFTKELIPVIRKQNATIQ